VITSLEAQFVPNGGSTIKDALNRIEHKLFKLDFMNLSHLDIVPTPIFLATENGKYTWVNKAYLRMVGMSFDEVLGSGWEKAINPIDRQRVKEEWYVACQEQRPFHCTYKMIAGNKPIFIHCDATGQEGVGYFGHIKEATEQDVSDMYITGK